MRRTFQSLAVTALILLPASKGFAQAWAYPAFQPPRTVSREFNFGVADANEAGTTLLFQWREEAGRGNQLSLDAGIADPNTPRSDLILFFGGQFAHQMTLANADMPLDFLFTVGVYLATSNFTLFRLPFGVSVGHRFALGGPTAITPYLHPRVSIDVCSRDCGDQSDLSLDFDLGLNFELTRTLAIRASALVAGSNRFGNDGFGIALAWKPLGLARSK
jgi:hypothetical protein